MKISKILKKTLRFIFLFPFRIKYFQFTISNVADSSGRAI